MVLCIEQDGHFHLKICNQAIFDRVNNQVVSHHDHRHDDDCPGCTDIALGDCDPEATTSKQSALVSPVVLISFPGVPLSPHSLPPTNPSPVPLYSSQSPDLARLTTVRLLT